MVGIYILNLSSLEFQLKINELSITLIKKLGYMNFDKIKEFLNKDVSEIFKREINIPKKRIRALFLAVLILLAFSIGVLAGSFLKDYFYLKLKDFIFEVGDYFQFFPRRLQSFEPKTPTTTQPQSQPYVPQTTQEEAVIKVVKEVFPSVVSIVITKDLPVYEQYFENPFEEFFGPDSPFEFEVPQYEQKGTEKREVGGGTGFIISKDGMVLTNKHVVSDTEAEYTVITNDGEKYSAEILAIDPVQDLAIIKIQKDEKGNPPQKEFKPVTLGDSSTLQIGQTVIAIGNALGEFNNTVSVGVISGLGRNITASGAGMVETLEDVIQTDAAINRGNSGGPLLNLKGQVIGVNVAMAEAAQSIGFAIPVDRAKRDIEQVKNTGKIVYPFLGVRYILITSEIQEKENLKVDYGALIVKGENANEPAVVPGSAADKAGIKEGDIILKLNGEKITSKNSLAKIIQNYSPGDKITLDILRGDKEITVQLTLGERSS